MSYGLLVSQLLPELILAAGVLVILFVDLGFMAQQPRGNRNLMSGTCLLVFCAIALFALFNQEPFETGRSWMVRSEMVKWVQTGILFLVGFTALLSISQNFTDHIGEYFSLILLSGIGMVLMAGTENLLMVFLSLELSSLCLYILAAFQKERAKSLRGALEYFLIGGISAAFTLYGISLIYGFAGDLEFKVLASALSKESIPPLLLAGIAMSLVGFGFKIAAVPFHLWAPVTYQLAPTPSAALIASGSKLAAIFLLAKFAMIGLVQVGGTAGWRAFSPGWIPLLAAVALGSIVLGNLVAIAQISLRRLIAFSAIAHAGYMLLGVLSNTAAGLSAVVYYGITYGMATVGIFGVIGLLERELDRECDLPDLVGLSRRAPVLAAGLAAFVLSLAGIPPLAGFFGKFFIFAAFLNSPHRLGFLWLLIPAILFTAVSLYYYLVILKKAYVEEGGRDSRLPFHWSQVTLLLLAVVLLVVGAFPHLLLRHL